MGSSPVAFVFGLCVLIVTVGVLWFHLVRPILEDFGVIRVPESVNTSEPVPSLQEPAQRQTTQTDRADRPSVSADDLMLPRMQLDRTKTAVIEVMVYNGWTVGEIRGVLKGDNNTIGAEVDAARKRLGVEPPELRTPIAGRPTDAKFASAETA